MTDLINTQLGPYQLIEAIGHGGMSSVYKAYQPSLNRFVAIKVLLANRDPQFAVRFKREAHAIAALQHQNILPIYDYNEQNGLLYFVMQYVENATTLSSLMGKAMEPSYAMRLIVQVLSALDYAHSQGIIHRDIKPANILMPRPNWVVLADFGIAKLMNDSQQLTMTGFIVGTAAYMAPEQAAGKPIDARTDLYSLGIVLYEMLTGRPPFDAETPIAMLTKQVYEPPPPPRSLNPNIHPAVEKMLLRALAKAPSERYQSAADMSAALERLISQFSSPRPSSQITSLYQAGVTAFQQSHWDEAIDLLGRLIKLDPTYEDAVSLLEVAQEAREHKSHILGPNGDLAKDKHPQNKETPIAEATTRTTSAHAVQVAPPARNIRSYLTGAVAQVTASLKRNRATMTLHALRCPQCGQPVRPEWHVCPLCSAPIAQIMAEAVGSVDVAPQQGDTVTKSKGRRWLPLASAIVAIIAIGGLGWGGWRLANQQPTKSPPIVALLHTSQATAAPLPTEAPQPTAALRPTSTPLPTEAPQPTAAPLPTNTPQPTDTPQPPTATPQPPDAVVKNTQQRLRGGPGQNYANLGMYTQGAMLTIVGKEATGTWVQVTAPDGQLGWMLAADLQVNLSLDNIPMVAAPPSPTPSPTAQPTARPRPTRTPAPQPTTMPDNPTSPPPPPEAPTLPPPEPPTPTDKPGPKPTDKPPPPPPQPTPKPKPTPIPLLEVPITILFP